jgi:hypothetical protein
MMPSDALSFVFQKERASLIIIFIIFRLLLVL